MTTRRNVLLVLRKQPGITVSQMAEQLGLTGMGVRRHLDQLQAEGLAEPTECARKQLGRPATGWRLSNCGLELFPRRYDGLAIELLEDVADQVGPEGLDALFHHRTDKLVADYEARLADTDDLEERVAELAAIRDEAGYLAEWSYDDDDNLVLTENNCAVHRVAQQFPAVCAQELALLRRVMGSDVEVTRTAHTMAGDVVCSYCIRPRQA